MRAVNLLPENATQRRLPETTIVPVAGAAAALVAAGVVGALAHSESNKVAKEQQRLDALKLQLARVPSASSHESGGTPLLASRASRVAALDAALSGRVAWDVVLRQIALVLPDDTWLDGMQLTSPAAPAASTTATTDTSSPTTPTTPTGVVINGFTSSPDGLARVIQRLGVVPTLSDVGLTSASAVQRGTKRVFQFTINANVATAGGGS